MVERLLQELPGADDVGRHEGRRSVDRAVDVCLGGKVDNRLRPKFREERRHERTIANVAVSEHQPRIVCDRRERRPAAGVGEFVEDDDAAAARAEPMADEPTAEKSRSTGDEIVSNSILHS